MLHKKEISTAKTILDFLGNFKCILHQDVQEYLQPKSFWPSNSNTRSAMPHLQNYLDVIRGVLKNDRQLGPPESCCAEGRL